jgi:hypothetical protein
MKYTLNKSYGTTHTGRERVIWNVIDSGCGTIIDTFTLRRDAKYYMDLWNSEAARNAVPASSTPAYYNADGGSMCNGIGRSYF